MVSSKDSACNPLNRFLVDIGKLVTGTHLSLVNNSSHFVESILDPTIHNNQMVSLNAVNLFTRGPTVEALIVTQKRLNWTPAMMNIQPSNIPFRVTLTQET